MKIALLFFVGAYAIAGCPLSLLAVDRASLALELSEAERFLGSCEIDVSYGQDREKGGKAQRRSLHVVIDDGNVRVSRSDAGSPILQEGIFNGSDLLVLEGKGGDFGRAVLTRDLSFLPWPIPPRVFLGEIDAKPLSDWVRETAVSLESRGPNVLACSGPVVDVDGKFQIKTVVFFDPSKNNAFARREGMIRYSPSSEWRTSVEVKVDGLEEFGSSGFYLPKSGSYRLRDVAGDKDSDVLLVKSVAIEFRNWIVPARVASDTFDLTIPDGVFVDDKINGRTYISHRTSDSEISQSVGMARRLGSGVRLSIVAINVAIVLCAGGALLYWKRAAP